MKKETKIIIGGVCVVAVAYIIYIANKNNQQIYSGNQFFKLAISEKYGANYQPKDGDTILYHSDIYVYSSEHKEWINNGSINN